MSMSSMQTSNYHSDSANTFSNSDDMFATGSSGGGGHSGGGMANSGGLHHSYSESNLMGGSSGGRSSSHMSSSQSFLGSGHSANAKHEDLKQMLESSKDGLKLEAMKRIIGMIAKGRSGDTPRELFAHVVKNVVTKNAELKKLVYLYLTRYAEQEQDLALLSIATFQRSLKDPNPLIRASAVRVLSSIRVAIIAPIMLIAIRDCSNDMSPYVRKTAAHAIPKLYALDPDLKHEIIDIVERLLNDRTALVLGSAVAAFEEVCGDRNDLIHQNYRKFCALLVDVDEWGQIILINMLIRYARTQFLDPNPPVSMGEEAHHHSGDPVVLDPDHRLLLRSAKPLLQSRNSGVVLAVIQMYLSLAPNSELNAVIVKPLIRLLHSHREIQLVVLKNIVTLTTAPVEEHRDDRGTGDEELRRNDKENMDTNADNANATEDSKDKQSAPPVKDSEDDSEEEEDFLKWDTGNGSGGGGTSRGAKKCIKSLFEPHLKSFFIKSRDSTQTKILKLEILTNLSNSANISLILREFQAYINNYQEDLEFMAATIQAIGHIAARIKEIAPVCLNGLITLLSNRNETIVAHSIVVIRTQIINKDEQIISSVVKQMVRLMDKIHTPQARATILWILAEFCPVNERAAKYAPDVLRKLAKTFCSEADTVKLQALNLAAKLYVTQDTSDRIKLLVNFLFNLAKYDLNYDVRDRGRLLRQLLNEPELAKRVLLVPKKVPDVGKGSGASRRSDGEHQFRIGTLSHFLDKKAADYEELPDWPLEQPDPSVRQRKEAYVEDPVPTFALVNIKDSGNQRTIKKLREKSFYSESEDDSEEESSEEGSTGDEESDEEVSDEDMSGEEEDDDEEAEDEESDEEESDEDMESGSDGDEEEEESDEPEAQVIRSKPTPLKASNSSKKC
ncbi:unnamed protein product [Oppiella nova]|uniref:AP-3 complex subunit beta n=1 Tax=Oppiella nova TaxID=334625 RepID=A0A7R9M644_9ACAR|nr:unnamed protein product [Oppiella nova]CAG2171359.1 unnamed protein product [Oppiella nova]